jgi:hypothetical protein
MLLTKASALPFRGAGRSSHSSMNDFSTSRSTSASGQVLAGAQLAVRGPLRGNCSVYGGWRDQLQVPFGHAFRAPCPDDCPDSPLFEQLVKSAPAQWVPPRSQYPKRSRHPISQMSLKLRSRVSCVVPRALLAPKWTCFGLERAQLDYLSNESSGTALGRSCRGWSKAFLNSLNNRLTLASIVDTKFNFFAFFGPKDHLPQRRGYREVSFL